MAEDNFSDTKQADNDASLCSSQSWKDEVLQIVKKIDGMTSLYISDLEGQEVLTLDEDTIYPAASVIKLPLMVTLYYLHANGELDLDQRITYSEKELELVGTEGSGILQYMKPGLNPTVKDLIYLSIIVSDNVATNMLMDVVGIERANQIISSLGYGSIKFTTKIGNYEAMADGKDNLISAREIARVLISLAKGELVSAQASREMVEILTHQQFKRLGMKLPSEVDVASKTGLLRGIRHDAGIIYARRPFVACVLTRYLKQPELVPDMMAEIGLTCFKYFNRA